MGKVKDKQLFTLIKNYLTVYLPVYRNVSENTITTYRTGLNEFLDYVAHSKNIPVTAVSADMFNFETVNEFLNYLSEDSHLSAATRNNRLAILRSFITYASACMPEYISLHSELSAIKMKKNDVYAAVEYMSEAAVRALFHAPDTSTELGVRDQFIMIFLYDTGARIQEALNVRLRDIKLVETPTVTLMGKGRKVRIVPLMKDTIRHLKNYLNVFHKNDSMLSEDWLFYTVRNGVRAALSSDAVRVRLQKYADSAREKCPDIPEKVYPHLFRHTRAMHLYQNGMDLTLVSQWLGHSEVKTTLVYAHADTEAKRQAIEKAMAGTGGCETTASKYNVTDEDLIKRLYGLK